MQGRLRRATPLGDAAVDFLAMYGDIGGGRDPESDLVPFDFDDANANAAVDDDFLIEFTA
jgi:hypothetical protein